MGTRIDQARTDAAFRRTKAERVKDKTSTSTIRKLDKDGLSAETRKAFKAYDKAFDKQSKNKSKPNVPTKPAKKGK